MGPDRPERAPATLYQRLVVDQLADFGDRPAIRVGDERISYRRLDGAIQQIRARLVAAGVVAGDRVLVRLPNSPALIAAILAAGAQGAVAVALDPRASAARTAWVTSATAPALILGSAAAEDGPGPRTLQLDLDPRSGDVAFSPDLGRPALEPTITVNDDSAPALILLSSGSTGRPKGAVLTHQALLWSARSLSRLFRFTPEHRELIFAPLAHSGAWQRAMATLDAGGEICLFSEQLSVPHLLAACERYGTTGFYTAPHLVRYLLNTRAAQVQSALASLRHLEVGSAELAADELAALLELLPAADFFVHYGLTECSRATVLDARRHPGKLGTVGRPRPAVEVAIADPDNRRLGPDEVGQILVRGPQMAATYWAQPDLAARAWRDGWLATGDQGSLDDEGFLTFRGRDDDLINCAGFTFFPREVETEFGEQPGVREYVVVRAADARGLAGDEPAAVVVPASPETFRAADFLAAARAALPPHMVPRRVITVAALPRTESGKLDRLKAAELAGGRQTLPDQPV